MVSLCCDALCLRLIFDDFSNLVFLITRLLGLRLYVIRLDCVLVTVQLSLVVGCAANVQAVELVVECWLEELVLLQIAIKLWKFLGFGGVGNFEIL